MGRQGGSVLVGAWALAVMAWGLTSMASAQAPEPRALEDQAAALAAYAEAVIEEKLPNWTPPQRHRWAEGCREAVFEATDHPLTAQEYDLLRRMVDGVIRSNYPTVADETIDFQIAVRKWMVADILSTPWPSPEDIAELKQQVHEWRVYLEPAITDRVSEALADLLDLPVEDVRAALAPAVSQSCQEYEEHGYRLIDDPHYRHERIPLTEAEMAASLKTLDEAITKTLGEVDEHVRRLIERRPREAPATDPQRPSRQTTGLRAATSYLGAYAGQCLLASDEHWQWHHPPQEVEELRKISGRVQGVVIEVEGPLECVRRTMLLLGGVWPEATGAAPGIGW